MIVLRLEACIDGNVDWLDHVADAFHVLDDLDAPVQLVTTRDHDEAEPVVDAIDAVNAVIDGSPILDVTLQHPDHLDQPEALYLANALDANQADVYLGHEEKDELAADVADVTYVGLEEQAGEELALELAGHYEPEGAF